MKLDPKSTKILIVGLGLLGGCYAQALTEKGFTVRAITLEQSSIDYAVSHGFLAGGATEPDAALIADSNLIVFALYPHIFVEWVEKYQHLFAPGQCILQNGQGGAGRKIHAKADDILCINAGLLDGLGDGNFQRFQIIAGILQRPARG